MYKRDVDILQESYSQFQSKRKSNNYRENFDISYQEDIQNGGILGLEEEEELKKKGVVKYDRSDVNRLIQEQNRRNNNNVGSLSRNTITGFSGSLGSQPAVRYAIPNTIDIYSASAFASPYAGRAAIGGTVLPQEPYKQNDSWVGVL